MEDRSKNSMLEAIKQLTTNIPKEAFKTFTLDRGKIFHTGKKWRRWEQISILQILTAHGREAATKTATVF